VGQNGLLIASCIVCIAWFAKELNPIVKGELLYNLWVRFPQYTHGQLLELTTSLIIFLKAVSYGYTTVFIITLGCKNVCCGVLVGGEGLVNEVRKIALGAVYNTVKYVISVRYKA
jgi:hypothetical protein